MKACFKCGVSKELEAFYKHSQMGDGHLNKCIECTKLDVRSHRIAHVEKYREYDRSRATQPHRVIQRAAYVRQYVEQNPQKKAAHTAVSNAVRDGKLKKLPCAFCGSTERLEGHHHDYSKPLVVTWLCSGCHSRFHALEAMARQEAA